MGLGSHILVPWDRLSILDVDGWMRRLEVTIGEETIY